MKTTISLFFAGISALASAQPTITNNEFYHIGDVIQMANCNATFVSPGAAGANVTWDFSALVPIGSFSTTSVSADTSHIFLASNLFIILPNGFREYMQESNTDSYVNGLEYPTNDTVINYANFDLTKRPFTYNSFYVDTYRVIVTSPFMHGTGTIAETGDAYGTLKLPTGTYNNVLRIQRYQAEADTVPGGGLSISTTLSYLWFDNIHAAPLFRMDSAAGTQGIIKDAMYLSNPTAIGNQNLTAGNFRGSLYNNRLTLSGCFVNGADYEFTVYNILGTVICTNEFVAAGYSASFELGGQLTPGMYFVGITAKYDPLSRQVIKVVRY